MECFFLVNFIKINMTFSRKMLLKIYKETEKIKEINDHQSHNCFPSKNDVLKLLSLGEKHNLVLIM